jgi:hypothetical protein
MPLVIAPLKEEHLVDAAALVSARYKALRGQIPLLPVHCEQPGAILDMLRELPAEADGVIALQDGRLVGFLAGWVIPEFMGRRTAYSPDWANAAALGHSRRIYEEMYARLSDGWVSDGCFTHLVSLMAHDRQGLEAWNWLGFGLVNVDGVRSLIPLQRGDVDVDVRQARLEDADELAELGRALERHEAAAPTFWIHKLGDFGASLRKAGNAA